MQLQRQHAQSMRPRSSRSMVRPALALVGLVAVAVGSSGCGGGRGGGGDPGIGGPFRVVTADAFPNGKLLPAVPSPGSENQFIRIEFSKGVDPATLFDHTTANGVRSGLRLINRYYTGHYSPQTPPDFESPETSRRLDGFLVWNGQTNLDVSTGTHRTQLLPIAPDRLGIALGNYQAAPNVVYFIADTDRNPATRESFLPGDVAPGLPASQIQVDGQPSIRSLVRNEPLEGPFAASFNVGDRDRIHPVLDLVEPAPGRQGVDINASIVIRFTEPIEASTAGPSDFQVGAILYGPGGPTLVPIPGSLSPQTGATFELRFTPVSPLPGDSPIKVTITPGGGNYLDLANLALGRTRLTDGEYVFRTGPGPQRANNPVPPQVVHFITQSSYLGAIETNEFDDVSGPFEDFYVPVDREGSILFPFPGGLMDIQIGPFIANNAIGNPPLQKQYVQLGRLQGNPPRPLQSPPPDIHIWTPPGTPPDLGLGGGPPATPIGNFLFVSNENRDVVHVINSNTYEHYKDIPAPDPRGLAIDPLLTMLFVSNFAGNSVTVFDITPDRKTGYPAGTKIKTIPTGMGPEALVVSPNSEDVLVVNRLENSASVIQISRINSNEPVRVKVSGNIGPACVDVCATGRIPPLPPMFPSLPYYAYFCNLGGNHVSVFESGPQQINGYGRDNIVQVMNDLPSPTAVNTDEMAAATASSHEPIPPNTSLTGCWVTCGDGTVKHLRAKRFRYTNIPNPPPAWIGADFEIASVIKVGERPIEVVVRDPFIVGQGNNNKAAPDIVASRLTRTPTRLYVVNGDGSVSVIDLAVGREALRLPRVDIRKMAAYYTN